MLPSTSPTSQNVPASCSFLAFRKLWLSTSFAAILVEPRSGLWMRCPQHGAHVVTAFRQLKFSPPSFAAVKNRLNNGPPFFPPLASLRADHQHNQNSSVPHRRMA